MGRFYSRGICLVPVRFGIDDSFENNDDFKSEK